MRRFLLLFSLFNLLIFSTQSCNSYKLENANVATSSRKIVENNYFADKETDYVYKAQIDVYGNHMSGILIIKKISDDTHRVVMTTDFGNKMLDFEISQKSFKINYLIADMDRDVVKKFLENDFRMLLKQIYTISEVFETKEYDVYTSVDDGKKYYLFYEKNSELLHKMVFTEKAKEKINFGFLAKTHIFADEILLTHQDFKLSISLKEITKN